MPTTEELLQDWINHCSADVTWSLQMIRDGWKVIGDALISDAKEKAAAAFTYAQLLDTITNR